VFSPWAVEALVKGPVISHASAPSLDLKTEVETAPDSGGVDSRGFLIKLLL
jgi:hypothetical protein